MSVSLGSNEVHLWHVAVDELPTGLLERIPGELLNADELARFERYRHAGARQLFLTARWLVRHTLSRYAPVEPRAWQFAVNGHGRPEVAVAGFESLRFNLSHSGGVVLLGIAREREIGVDVEQVDERRDLLGIANHSFARAEIEQVEQTSVPERAERFFAIWTLKEAYIKARGMGLAFPLDRFSLSQQPGQPTSFAVDPALDPAPDDWLFHDWRLRERHHAALFVRGRNLAVLLRHALTPEIGPVVLQGK